MGCRGREEMGGMRWAKGEVRRKDCVRVIMARRVSVPCAATVVVSKRIPPGRCLELCRQRAFATKLGDELGSIANVPG